MKKLKKFAALLLVGVMALALLTACGVAAMAWLPTRMRKTK